MKIKERVDYIRKFKCIYCGLRFSEEEFTSEDEDGYDLCPSCGENEFKELE